MARLTKKQRWQIVHEMERCGNATRVAKHVGCSEEAVRRWWRVHSATGDVQPRKSSGRKPLLGPDARDATLKLLVENKIGGSSSVAKHLKAEGITSKLLDRKTIARAAWKAAAERGIKLTVERRKPKPGMTESTRLKRLHFAGVNKRRDWNRVMFTDRSKFHFSYPGSKVHPCRWKEKGSTGVQGTVYQPTHPQVLNIYAGITKYGVSRFHIVAGSSKYKSEHLTKRGTQARNITQSEMREVLKKTLLPEGQRLFSSQGIGSWVLQLDGDRCHRVAKQIVKEWNEKKGSAVSVLEDWPPHSPDLSPIENFWGWVQAQVNKKGCASFDQYTEEVKRQMSKVPKRILVNYYNSMKKRLERVLDRQGGYTGY